MRRSCCRIVELEPIGNFFIGAGNSSYPGPQKDLRKWGIDRGKARRGTTRPQIAFWPSPRAKIHFRGIKRIQCAGWRKSWQSRDTHWRFRRGTGQSTREPGNRAWQPREWAPRVVCRGRVGRPAGDSGEVGEKGRFLSGLSESMACGENHPNQHNFNLAHGSHFVGGKCFSSVILQNTGSKLIPQSQREKGKHSHSLLAWIVPRALESKRGHSFLRTKKTRTPFSEGPGEVKRRVRLLTNADNLG